MITDKQIISALCGNDRQDVIAELYRRTMPKVRGYILRNGGNQDDASDMFQDALVIFYGKLKTREFDVTKDIDGYIYVMARNLWINKVKRDQKIRPTEILPEKIDQDRDLLGTLMTDEKHRAIQAMLNKVGERCAELLRLTILEDYSLKDVAFKLGLKNEGVAKTNNYRCKQKLTELIKSSKHYQLLIGSNG